MSFQSACYFKTTGEMGKPLQANAMQSADPDLGNSDRSVTIPEAGVYQLSTMTELDLWSNNGSANTGQDGCFYRLSFQKWDTSGTYEVSYVNVPCVGMDPGTYVLVGANGQQLKWVYQGSYSTIIIADQPMYITLTQGSFSDPAYTFGVDANINVELLVTKLC